MMRKDLLSLFVGTWSLINGTGSVFCASQNHSCHQHHYSKFNFSDNIPFILFHDLWFKQSSAMVTK